MVMDDLHVLYRCPNAFTFRSFCFYLISLNVMEDPKIVRRKQHFADDFFAFLQDKQLLLVNAHDKTHSERIHASYLRRLCECYRRQTGKYL